MIDPAVGISTHHKEATLLSPLAIVMNRIRITSYNVCYTKLLRALTLFYSHFLEVMERKRPAEVSIEEKGKSYEECLKELDE